MALTVTDRPIGYVGYFEHGWSCAHLPIAYKMESDLYPVNSVDTIGLIGGLAGSNGYTQLNFSPSLSLTELDFVLVRHDPDGGANYINEPFQILEVISSSSIIINLAWPNSFSFYSVQSYHGNYHAVVNVYAGLNASHHFASEKPYELAATLRFIPDSNNEIHFSINEILKSYLDIRNNTSQTTLPNDLESFTQFYISYYESYDQSNGYTIGTFNGSTTVDSEEGYAGNSILEFKNQYSGFLSDYVINPSLTQQKFLTLFETQTIFDNKFFDVSFIRDTDDSLNIRKNWVDIDGNVIYTSVETLQNYSAGIYRVPLTIEHGCTFENVHPPVYSNVTTYLSTTTFTPSLGGFTQLPSGPNLWTYDGGPNAVLWYDYAHLIYDSVPTMIHTISIPQGTTIRVQFALYQAFISGTVTISLIFSGVAACIYHQVDITQGPLDSFYYDFNVNLPSGFCDYTSFQFYVTGGLDVAKAIDMDYIIITNIGTLVTPSYTTTDPLYLKLQVTNGSDDELSEIKNFNLNCDCENQSIYLTWLNNLGAYEYWNFTAFSEYGTDLGETGETKTNIFQNWPTSYGRSASEIRKQTFRNSSKRIVVSSQHLTLEEKLAIEYIRSSIVVEIMYSQYDKRRVIVDQDSFVSYKDNDKLYTVSFSISYTDNIPSQRL